MATPRKGSGKKRAPWRGEGSRRAIVLHPDIRIRGGDDGLKRTPAARLEEAVGLAHAIDLEIVHAESIKVDKPKPGTLFGMGVIERFRDLAEALEVELIVVDGPLSPVQQRNLERELDSKVIDRTGLILEIFGARANTREGTLQVELAALSYQRSRLVRSWTHLERQRGGLGFIGGPGESQIELDRRLIDERIAKLKRELDQVKRTRSLHRESRRKVPYPIVALVGYTNAGKSTLFNRLTKAEVLAQDMLFATLDPTMRSIALPSGAKIILSDTVGFISDLPTDLVAAFRATLEEVISADLILHVRDAANEDTEIQKKDVEAVLESLGRPDAGDRIEVMNKIDMLDGNERAAVLSRAVRDDNVIAVSAVTGENCETLCKLVDVRISAQNEPLEVLIPHEDGARLAWLYRHGDVQTREEREDGIFVRVMMPAYSRDRYLKLYEPGEGDASSEAPAGTTQT